MVRDDVNTKSKKKETPPRIADTSGLRRSGRETSSKNQATASLSNTRKSERIEKQTLPNPSPAKKKTEIVEKTMGPSPLRRSDRGKKSDEVPASPDINSKKEKNTNIIDLSAEYVREDNKNERKDLEKGDRKRKRNTARDYKDLFKPQRMRIPLDNDEDLEAQDKSVQANTSSNGGEDKELKCQNSIRVQEAPNEAQAELLDETLMGSDQVEHVGHPSQTKPLDGKSAESGNLEKQIGGECSPSKRNVDHDACTDNGNNISHTTSSSESLRLFCWINRDLENQQELDPSDKVTGTCKAARVTENAGNNDATANVQNSGSILNSSKFLEFWVPVPMSNVQVEQYCATLLSNAMSLRSSLRDYAVGGALHDIFMSNRKCCNHPYVVDPKLQNKLMEDRELTMLLDVGIKASGKLHFLDLVLPEVKKRKLRVLILFQPTVVTAKESPSVGVIFFDYVHQRFGQDSYECVVSGISRSERQTALNSFNNDMNRFIFFLEHRSCHPSIKLASVDIIIMLDSDLNPANDLRALQKVSIDSQSEQIMIFRLYSLSTLEEKILKLAENMPFDSRWQNTRSRYDALLMWGASNLFDKLAEFHNQSALSISSEETFMKDIVEEFLYVISHKSENKDTSKSIFTRVQKCGIYGKNIPLHGEINTHLPDGDQPHIFWKNLLEGRNPIWKFVSILTPRQRKRPHYFEGWSKGTRTADGGGMKTRKKTVNNTAEPSQLKCVIEGETGGGSRVPAHNKPQSLSGDPSQSAGVSNEKSLHDLLKSTVSELCNVLKFSEDVKIIVRTFLEFVLENYIISSEDKSTLQAFMISVCWIGSSILKNKIDRSESFAIAKKYLNSSCMLNEANMVYEKLKSAEETFLVHTEIDDPIRACIPATQGVKLDTEKYQRIQTNEEEPNKCNKQTEDFFRQEQEEIGKFNREWDEKRVKLENDYNMDRTRIHTLYSNLYLRSEKLTILKKEFANILEEHERLREIHLKDLEAKLLAAKAQVAVNTEVPLRGSGHDSPEAGPAISGNPIEAQSLDEPMSDIDVSIPNVLEGDGANNIELTISHTSAKQTTDVLVLNEPIGEVPTQGHSDTENEVVGADATVLREPDGEILAQLHDDIENVVAGKVDFVEMEVLKDDSKQENAKDATNCPEGSRAVKDGNETGPNDVVPHTGNGNKENGRDASHAIEGVSEIGPNDVAPHINSIEMGKTSGNCNKENAEYGTISADKSHAGEDHGGSCGTNSSNPLPADVSQEKALLVQPIASPAPHHLVSTIPEIENESLDLQQLPHSEVADKEGQANPSSLAVINDEPSVIAENQLYMPSSFRDLEALAPPGSLEIQNQNASGPELNMLDNLNHVGSRMLSVSNPLQAEVEQLYAMKDNVIRSLEEIQQNIKSDCEKEIAETIAHIRLKYEAKSQDAVAASVLKKNEIDSNLNRVVMNKVLADAFRSKCQDHTVSGHSGMQRASQDALMEQLHRFSGSSIMRHPLGTASTSTGQFSRSQQTPPPPSLQPPPPSPSPPSPPPPPSHPPPPPPPPSPSPPPPPPSRIPRPPLQIVDQPSALFSTPPSRPSPPPTTNLRTPSTTPIRPPTNTNPAILDSVSTRLLPNLIIPSTSPTKPPIIARVNPSTTLVTGRPAPDISPITPGNNLRPPPGRNPVTPSSIANKSPTIRPVTNGLVRSPAPHLRPMARSEFRSPAPHLRPMASSEIWAPPTHIRPFRDTSSVLPDLATNPRMVPGHVTSSLPPTSNSLSPVLPPFPTSSPQLLPPLPSEPCFVPPPPPPPSSLPTISSPLPSLPTSGKPALAANVHMDNAAHSVNIRAGSTQSSGHDLVCLSDDD